MRIEEDIKLDFKDVLIRPKRSTLGSRKDVDLNREYVFKWSGVSWTGVPIIAANMDGVGTFAMAKAFVEQGNQMQVALRKHYSVEEIYDGLVTYKNLWYTTGITLQDRNRLMNFTTILDRICVDVANGYQEDLVAFVGWLRSIFPNATIMVGNVVTGEMVEQLLLSGADIVKIGIGPGSVCTTRRMTGVGYPQLSAIIECADAAHGLGGHVCADGGCTCPGDIAKAFGAGADFVMLGGMLAGHDECEQTIVQEAFAFGAVRPAYVEFYGMSSEEAMEKHAGGVAEHRAPEGKKVRIPYRGPVKKTVDELLGGLRSACTYVGARKLKELPKRTTFVRVTQQLNGVFNESA
jgi:GMP reductase